MYNKFIMCIIMDFLWFVIQTQVDKHTGLKWSKAKQAEKVVQTLL